VCREQGGEDARFVVSRSHYDGMKPIVLPRFDLRGEIVGRRRAAQSCLLSRYGGEAVENFAEIADINRSQTGGKRKKRKKKAHKISKSRESQRKDRHIRKI